MNPIAVRTLGICLLLVPLAAIAIQAQPASLEPDIIDVGKVKTPQPDESLKKPVLPDMKKEFVDVVSCFRCHKYSAAELREDPTIEAAARQLVRMQECNIWWNHDLHRKAYVNIVPNPKGGPDGGPNLAERMQRVLKQSRGENYEVARAVECRVCHSFDATWKVGSRSKEVKIGDLDDLANPRFDVRFGVSCEACHGIVDERWGTGHADPKWRLQTPQYKSDQGQIDLRDPIVRAERCASCHVGSENEQKFVTHEMYAAGHPPLPALEVATFSQEQPAHYYPKQRTPYFLKQTAKEKNGDNKDVPSLWTRFHYREGEIAEVRELAYGSVVAFRSAVQLLNRAQSKSGSGMLDFSHFDCAACHHDLTSRSDRQNRTEGITGRPLLNMQTELLNVVLDHACSEKETAQVMSPLRDRYRIGLDNLKTAARRRPFGDMSEIEKAVKELETTTAEILKAMEPIVYNKETALRLYQKLTEKLESLAKSGGAKSTGYVDFDAAEQLTWALLLVRRELNLAGQDWEKAKANLAKVLPLVLRDPKGEEPLESVEKRLQARLKRQYEFQSSKFFKAIDGLPKLSGEK